MEQQRVIKPQQAILALIQPSNRLELSQNLDDQASFMPSSIERLKKLEIQEQPETAAEVFRRKSFDAAITRDIFNVYNGNLINSQQKCLVHLQGHFKTLANLGYGNNSKGGQVIAVQICQQHGKVVAGVSPVKF